MSETYCVYISCVGEQDPISERTKDEGALMTCFRYLTEKEKISFNAAYFIPSSREFSPERHTEGKAEECKSRIQENYPNLTITILPLKVKNPADLKQVYPKMRELLASIASEMEEVKKKDAAGFFYRPSH